MTLLDDMSSKLGLDKNYILHIADNSSRLYRSFSIPKRNGGYRTIFQPSPVLKTLQYFLVHSIFKNYPISQYARAYEKGHSIKENARIHSDARFVLHTDIKNFFESIKTSLLAEVFIKNEEITKRIGITPPDYELIYRICFYGDHLTIGSASSPVISNIVMYRFDEGLRSEINLEWPGLVYTRYADDMVFSSKHYISRDLIKVIQNRLKSSGFSLNEGKTHFMSSARRKMVTGLIVDKGVVSVGTNRKKEIKKMLYKKLKYNIGNSMRILGYLYFLKDIEPLYFNSIIVKYAGFGNVIEILRKSIQDMELLSENQQEVAATGQSIEY